jgi:phage terminase large subunit-like protein
MSALRHAEQAADRARGNSLARYRPYPKQAAFHAAGATHRERLLMAGNQLGKTIAGGFEAAMHATGLYPEDWQGRVFPRATVAWAAGVTGQSTRDNVQRILLGRPGAHGTGAIPKEHIEDIVSARGTPELVDTIRVKHTSGAVSTIGLKSYEKGREKWQGETLDWLWFDEEPPLDIYSEGLTRTNATGGLAWMTFTPLLGMSGVVARFLTEDSPDRHVTQMTIDDVAHYTAAEKAKIIAAYPAHEREARARGVPILGSGRVFAVEEGLIKESAPELAAHWPRIAGIDIGTDHPTAVAWLAWDRDADIVHVYDCYRLSDAVIPVHASAIKARGAWIPVAWPHDALKRDGALTGEQFKELYAREGVNMLPERSTFENTGGASVEAGVADMATRMKTGRLKVAAHLTDWFEEFRLYHRKNGLIVKERDDLLSATRYALMMVRYAKAGGPAKAIDYSGVGRGIV